MLELAKAYMRSLVQSDFAAETEGLEFLCGTDTEELFCFLQNVEEIEEGNEAGTHQHQEDNQSQQENPTNAASASNDVDLFTPMR